MTKSDFTALLTDVATTIGARPLDADLDVFLNETYPGEGETVSRIAEACESGIRDGWLCESEHRGIRFGRPIEASDEMAGFSVDVVLMNDCKGPYHAHPQGEIDLILPRDPEAAFDGRGRGWLVYGPGTEHFPTVSDGEAIVLYLLPNGEIEFKRPPEA